MDGSVKTADGSVESCVHQTDEKDAESSSQERLQPSIMDASTRVDGFRTVSQLTAFLLLRPVICAAGV